MGAMNVAIKDNGIQTELQKLRGKLERMKPVLDKIGSLLESRINQRFDTKSSPSGAPWAPWAPSTAAARAKEGRGTLLEYSGRMRDSLTHSATESAVTIGFGVDYAKYHEHGKRRMLGATDTTLGEGDQRAVSQLLDTIAKGLV